MATSSKTEKALASRLRSEQTKKIRYMLCIALDSTRASLTKQYGGKMPGPGYQVSTWFAQLLRSTVLSTYGGLPSSLMDVAVSIVMSNSEKFPRGTLKSLLALKTYDDSGRSRKAKSCGGRG